MRLSSFVNKIGLGIAAVLVIGISLVILFWMAGLKTEQEGAAPRTAATVEQPLSPRAVVSQQPSAKPSQQEVKSESLKTETPLYRLVLPLALLIIFGGALGFTGFSLTRPVIHPEENLSYSIRGAGTINVQVQLSTAIKVNPFRQFISLLYNYIKFHRTGAENAVKQLHAAIFTMVRAQGEQLPPQRYTEVRDWADAVVRALDSRREGLPYDEDLLQQIEADENRVGLMVVRIFFGDFMAGGDLLAYLVSTEAPEVISSAQISMAPELAPDQKRLQELTGWLEVAMFRAGVQLPSDQFATIFKEVLDYLRASDEMGLRREDLEIRRMEVQAKLTQANSLAGLVNAFRDLGLDNVINIIREAIQTRGGAQ